jgi:hypothetical protein
MCSAYFFALQYMIPNRATAHVYVEVGKTASHAHQTISWVRMILIDYLLENLSLTLILTFVLLDISFY